MFKVITNKVYHTKVAGSKKVHIGWSLMILFNECRHSYYQYITNTKTPGSISARNYFKLVAIRNYRDTQYCDLVANYFEKNKDWHKKRGHNG